MLGVPPAFVLAKAEAPANVVDVGVGLIVDADVGVVSATCTWCFVERPK